VCEFNFDGLPQNYFKLYNLKKGKLNILEGAQEKSAKVTHKIGKSIAPYTSHFNKNYKLHNTLLQQCSTYK